MRIKGRVPRAVCLWILTFVVRLVTFPVRILFRGLVCLINKMAEPRVSKTDKEEVEEEVKEELPDFCQLIELDEDTSIIVEYVQFCPDETAFIRIVGEGSFTKQYKRRVYRDKVGRYFNLSNVRHYLDDAKTSPIMSK